MMIVISTSILLGLNLIAKLIIVDYGWFNLLVSSLVLCNSAIILYVLFNPNIADGFRVSMSVVYTFINTFLFILSQFCNQSVAHNIVLVAIIMIVGLEWIVYVLIKRVALHNNNKE